MSHFSIVGVKPDVRVWTRVDGTIMFIDVRFVWSGLCVTLKSGGWWDNSRIRDGRNTHWKGMTDSLDVFRALTNRLAFKVRVMWFFLKTRHKKQTFQKVEVFQTTTKRNGCWWQRAEHLTRLSTLRRIIPTRSADSFSCAPDPRWTWTLYRRSVQMHLRWDQRIVGINRLKTRAHW